jgi:uncharacterized RDD family membrane protein YckC
MVDVKYKTFWRRFGAALVDTLVVLPLEIGLLWALQGLKSAPLLALVYSVHATYCLVYSVVLHGRYGQTVGKMATRVKVVDLSQGPIGMRRALLRDSPWIGLAVADAVCGSMLILREGHIDLFGSNSGVLRVLTLASILWTLAEFLTMMTNRRRRAIHDWIAGTLVVRTRIQTDV